MPRVDECICATCGRSLPATSFSRHQHLKLNSYVSSGTISNNHQEQTIHTCMRTDACQPYCSSFRSKCKTCVEVTQVQAQKSQQKRLKPCVQCFQHLPKSSFSKRQAQLLDAKCIKCVQEFERAAAASPADAASELLQLRPYWLLSLISSLMLIFIVMRA